MGRKKLSQLWSLVRRGAMPCESPLFFEEDILHELYNSFKDALAFK